MRDPDCIYGDDPENDELDQAPWDEPFDPGPDLPDSLLEAQAEWESLDAYEKELERTYE